MKSLLAAIVLAAFGLLLGSRPAESAISVEPVVLEIQAPNVAGAIKLKNSDQNDVTVQTRVFQWVQANGQEQLSPTTDVAASPPIVTLHPGANYTVRLVRTASGPVIGEESYRILVDELPDLRGEQANRVSILIRQSIPVFFRGSKLSRPDVHWSYRIDGDFMEVIATNRGDDRLRVASLRLHDDSGKEVFFGNGLVGYVLGRSSVTFKTRLGASGFGAAETVTLETDTSTGHIQALASRVSPP